MVSADPTSETTNQSTQSKKPPPATLLMPSATSNLPPTYPTNPTELIKAVIIRCDSAAYPVENDRNYQPTFISPLETQLHTDDDPFCIPSLVGLPLWTRPHAWAGPHGDQRKPESESAIENPYARAFFVDGNAESALFGTAPSVKGDRLFGRMDGRDLSCQHLVCLGAFCNAVVEAFWKNEAAGEGGGEGGLRRSGRNARGVGESGGRERAGRFRGMVRREEFQRYWFRWCRKKFEASGLEEWLRQRGPFDV